MIDKNRTSVFRLALLKWDKMDNDRPMPWKGEKDPYKIWLSEIILQQTRVEQGWAYYERFIKSFPTVQSLAVASETKVFKLWEGLGYYTRCKNLIATAKFIAHELNGEFPSSYDAILDLKGIGPYTAAAIASFAYNLPYAVVDGNVFRILARYFGIDTAIDSAAGKRLFTLMANDLLDKKQAGIYNQALMDFGAVMCKPQLPICSTCPLQKSCKAYADNRVNEWPVKEKKIIKKSRWFYYLIIPQGKKIAVRKRTGKDIWENLYEFPLVESTKAISLKKLIQTAAFKKWMEGASFVISPIGTLFQQQLTHQTIKGKFLQVQIKGNISLAGYEMVSLKKLSTLPFPKLIAAFLEKEYRK